MNIVDYFSNKIEVGDVVLRVQNGYMYTTKVLRIRPSGIGLQRLFHQGYNETTEVKPLWVKPDNQIINLSKLDSSKIQETIKSFINEI